MEVEGTSLAMAQGKASPVPAPEPMFRVSPVLRRYDADACHRRPSERVFSASRYSPRLSHITKLGGGTPHHPLSAATKFGYVAKPWGCGEYREGDALKRCALSESTICNAND